MPEPTLSYRIEGQGPALLLVHGFVISFNIWRNLLPRLREHFRLVMIELPGSGGSPLPPEDRDYLRAALDGIEAVREELGLETWDVLGYSSGSRIAEAYIRAYPARVCHGIFLCPVYIRGLKVAALRAALELDRRLPASGDWVLSGWRLRFLISLFGFNLQPDPLCDDWYAEIGSAPRRALKETLRAVAPAADRPFEVPVPFDLIWGDRDTVPSRLQRFTARDHLVHGQHAAPVEAAEQVASTILSLRNRSG